MITTSTDKANTSDQDSNKTPDEKPAAKRAKDVITPKHKYFFPQHSVEIEATSSADAERLLKMKINAKPQKEGDE